MHELLCDLRFFNDPNQELPSKGIYFFYEDGELCERDGVRLERIVRVGTHRGQGNLPGRLHYHYYGNKNGSVFRKHMGGAILAQADPNDPRLSTWLAQDTPTLAEVESQVSQILRNRFRFRCIRVDDANQRLALEECLIGTLSGCAYCRPSATWLGKFARDEKIRLSGLWNSQHTDSLLHLRDTNWFTRFQMAVERTATVRDDKMKTPLGSAVSWDLVNERIVCCTAKKIWNEASYPPGRFYVPAQFAYHVSNDS
jgi:hypothetical protein